MKPYLKMSKVDGEVIMVDDEGEHPAKIVGESADGEGTSIEFPDGTGMDVEHLPPLKVGDKVRLLVDDMDCDEEDEVRTNPAGAIGEVSTVDTSGPEGSLRYHCTFPNGMWTVYEHGELHTLIAPVEVTK